MDLSVGDLDHGGSNSAVNNSSIASGYNAVQSGGIVITVPYVLTWSR